jgi:hypothetical protein
MREFQQKHLLRTVIYSRATILVLFLAVVLLLRSIMELNDKRLEVKKLTETSEIEKRELEEKVYKSEEKNKEIATSRGREAYIRTTYPVVKEGEGVIVVYDGKPSAVAEVRTNVSMWEGLLLWWRGMKNK